MVESGGVSSAGSVNPSAVDPSAVDGRFDAWLFFRLFVLVVGVSTPVLLVGLTDTSLGVDASCGRDEALPEIGAKARSLVAFGCPFCTGMTGWTGADAGRSTGSGDRIAGVDAVGDGCTNPGHWIPCATVGVGFSGTGEEIPGWGKVAAGVSDMEKVGGAIGEGLLGDADPAFLGDDGKGGA